MNSFKVAAAVAALAAGASASPAGIRGRASIPDFALQYAPYVWLDKGETAFPAAIDVQLANTHPEVNFTSVTGGPSPLTMDNLSQLNGLSSDEIYLSSNDDFTKYPAWLNATPPDASGKSPGDPSCAIIVAEKPNDIVDVFYMYFFPLNVGDYVDLFGQWCGNHVGDWEHNAIRFVNGTPQSVWFSQHSSGEAFTYDAVQKFQAGDRIVDFSGQGTHANYAEDGEHDHTIPNLNLPFSVFLTDYTSAGTLWDPTANAYMYSYDVNDGSFTAYDGTSPTDWLNFSGAWGDDELPDSDPRQKVFSFLGFPIDLTAEWTGGPTGPASKDLNRTNICPDGEDCTIRTFLTS